MAIAAFAAILCAPAPGSAASILGSAENFAVLGASTVTNTGPTVITGDLGVSPGLAVTGFSTVDGGPGIVNGTIHTDGVAGTAQNDLTKAYNGLKNMKLPTDLTGKDLGGLTLNSGVYKFDSSAQLTGTLKLDAQGNNNAYWVFQIGSSLTTASNSSVDVIRLGSNGGIDDGVFWVLGTGGSGSATLGGGAGVGTNFEGNILAQTSITFVTDSTILNGRALAIDGAVSLDTNVISIVCPNNGPGYSGGLMFNGNGDVVPVPVPGTVLLLGSGLLGVVFRKKKIV
jgi:type VI secretion system secreted protein VgrG